MMEYLEMDPARKWAYMQRYHTVASEFYQASEHVVSEDEIDACIRGFKEKPRTQFRKQITLKNWRFKLDPDDQGIRQEYFTPGYDDRQWEQVTTPHSCHYIPEPMRFGRLDCNLVKTEAVWQGVYDAWYRTFLPPEALRDDQTAYLCFESVNLISNVWFNDNPVMLDHAGLYPFKVDIGDELHRRTGDPVAVAVRARNVVTNHPNLFYNGWQFAYRNPPYTSGPKTEDWADQADAGIAGEVVLVVVNHNHLEDVFIETRSIGGEEAALVCHATLRNASKERFHGRLRMEISPWLPEESESTQTVTSIVETLPMNETCLDLAFTMQHPRLWNVDHPNLYLAHIILEDADGQAIDDLYESFGVRTIKIVGSSFVLNNEAFVPRGTHDVAVYYGESEICPSDRIIVKDILLHKKMGANCSRWPSDKSQHYKRLAEYCDQLGFMLSWVGYLQIWTVHPELEMLATRDVKTLVRSLRNCPSLIIWGMGDEPLMREHPFRRIRWYEFIYNLVSAEDQSRPILPAGDYCRDLFELIRDRAGKEGSLEAARAKVLEDYPVYDLKLAGWDYHHCPPGTPLLPFIDLLRNALGGHKPTVFTEFGIYGVPELAKVIDVYGKFRWASSPLYGVDMVAYSNDFYGKQIGPQDWKETQACQATLLSTIIGRLRSYPREFAAYYLVTMFDAWTFMWGVVDVHGNPKLAYWVARSCYQPVYISGLHGNTVVKADEEIAITVSNYGETLVGTSLKVRILDRDNRVVKEQVFPGIEIAGGVELTTVGHMVVEGLAPGLFSIEFYLHSKAEEPVAKTVELFFLEE